MPEPIDTPFPLPLIINDKDVVTTSEFTVTDPVSGTVLWSAYGATTDHAVAAVEAAQAAFPAWSRLAWSKRRDYLLKLADVLESRGPEIVATSIQETGTSDTWEQFDTYGAIHMLREVASSVSRIEGRIPPTEGRSAIVQKVPYGVVLSIVPWNAPILLGVRAFAYPLAAGNTVVFKGSELTPRTHYLLADSFRAAGFPPGVISLIQHAPGGSVGPEVIRSLISHPAVRKINFRGSSAVGSIIGELAGRYIKPVLLELGGKATVIILEDADLEAAAIAIADGANENAGQICVGTERVAVVSSVADKFIATLKSVYESRYGDLSKLTPVTQASSVARIDALQKKALEGGAEIVYGGQSDAQNPRRIQPTIFTNVKKTNVIYKTESFAPFVAVVVADTDEEALQVANDSDYGLSSAIWSRDLHKALKLSQGLTAGLVHINGSTVYDEPTLPYGGVKSSGIGRFGGSWGIEEFLTVKTITIPLI